LPFPPIDTLPTGWPLTLTTYGRLVSRRLVENSRELHPPPPSRIVVLRFIRRKVVERPSAGPYSLTVFSFFSLALRFHFFSRSLFTPWPLDPRPSLFLSMRSVPEHYSSLPSESDRTLRLIVLLRSGEVQERQFFRGISLLSENPSPSPIICPFFLFPVRRPSPASIPSLVTANPPYFSPPPFPPISLSTLSPFALMYCCGASFFVFVRSDPIPTILPSFPFPI